MINIYVQVDDEPERLIGHADCVRALPDAFEALAATFRAGMLRARDERIYVDIRPASPATP